MVWSSSNYYFADINEVTLLCQDQSPSLQWTDSVLV